MTPFQLIALFLGLAALLGWVNARFLHLPSACVNLATGLAAAAGLLTLSRQGSGGLADTLIGAIRGLDFPKAVIGYGLGFLLFAGAMQVDLGELRRHRLPVFFLATIGVGLSTIGVGASMSWIAGSLAVPLGLAPALAFGALISPTDPVAVLAAVKAGSLSKRLQAVLQGEALFNDGVGIVVFTALSALAFSGTRQAAPTILFSLALQTFGAGLLGAAAALLCLELLKRVDDYAVEISLTLALAAGAYAVAEGLGVSGPITVVVAGLLIGERGPRAMSEHTLELLKGFWSLIEELLTALLFLLLGLELVVVRLGGRILELGLAAFVLITLARFLVVVPWGALFHFRQGERGPSLILAWGGLHGALSLALALSLPPSPARPVLQSLTFVVVVVSTLVQGLTFRPLTRVLGRFPGG